MYCKDETDVNILYVVGRLYGNAVQTKQFGIRLSLYTSFEITLAEMTVIVVNVQKVTKGGGHLTLLLDDYGKSLLVFF